jgi:predicted lipoprotein with Yx(FWY)xxD motif
MVRSTREPIRRNMRTRKFALVAVLALLVAACGGGDDTGASTTEGRDDAPTTVADEPTTTAEDMTTTTVAGDTATTGAEMMDGVHASDTDLGSILVDGEGFTLYIFTNDTDGASTCYDACADTWPPIPGDTTISPDLDSSIFGTTTRDDGSEQLTVNGMPLYLYAPDSQPGDTTGQGVGGVWFVVDDAGEVIEAAAGSRVVDYGY